MLHSQSNRSEPPQASAIDSLLDRTQAPWFVTAPRSGVPSAWYGHVPFAMWLMLAARPRLLVELGTHNGVSYAAFCEAARSGHLETRCFAVDTWQGDDHAGFYAESVFTDLQNFHDERYAAFSRMLRLTFDDAVDYFEDGSIDLLHIDGCHSYDAVKHDFETWRPKLSPRALVLFHDTNVRERHFGVWRLWAELAQHYPHFEFIHEHGLGVLAVGGELEGPAMALCRVDDPADIAELRLRFALTGQRCRAEADRQQVLGDVQASAKRREQAERARAEIASALDRQQQELAASLQECERLDLIALAQEARAAELRADLAATKGGLALASEQLASARLRLEHQDLQIAHYRHFEQSYHQLLASTSWRVTRPLRAVVGAIPRPVGRMARRAVKAAWWAATPWKLQRRLERRRQFVALANAPPRAEPAPEPLPSPPVDRFSLDHIAKPDSGYVPMIRWYDPIAPEVSIVVLNWHGLDMTKLCLQHLWQHTTGHRYEIIVVDNGSAPEEVARLEADAPLVRVIALGSNRFFGEANNIGVEAARGRFVCLLNNDAFVPPGWLEKLRAVFELEPQVGAVGPRFLYPDGGLQEAGALINSDGTALQLGKGASPLDPAFRQRRVVDYVSAACVLLRREDFVRVLGFDLAWDPAYYEDVDLCLKLRLLGLRSLVTPDVDVVHIENATSTNRGSSLRLGNVVAINRTKFLGRWGAYLASSGARVPSVLPTRKVALAPSLPEQARTSVVIYTPYPLTPGGGERYVLTIAESFKDIARVTLVTLHPISRIRLLTMAREFGLDLDHVAMARPSDLERGTPADLAIVLGNELFPTVGRMGLHNLFICQFPFPFRGEQVGARLLPNWHEFERVVCYSDYVREHIERQAALWNVPPHPIEVLHPPVPMVRERCPKRPGQILHVGRFFTGGHCKRQDAMIEAFGQLIAAGVEAELHLAGSTMPEPVHRAYYAALIEQAAGLPVRFHANCSTEALHLLYAESDLYWHATGVGADIEAEPHKAEHFGISVVEAMSARCIPIVFAAGGPAVIVQDGITGQHYQTLEELAAKTRTLLETPSEAKEAMRDAAEAAAHAYDEPTFRAHVRAIADRLVRSAPEPVASSRRPDGQST